MKNILINKNRTMKDKIKDFFNYILLKLCSLLILVVLALLYIGVIAVALLVTMIPIAAIYEIVKFLML